MAVRWSMIPAYLHRVSTRGVANTYISSSGTAGNAAAAHPSVCDYILNAQVGRAKSYLIPWSLTAWPGVTLTLAVGVGVMRWCHVSVRYQGRALLLGLGVSTHPGGVWGYKLEKILYYVPCFCFPVHWQDSYSICWLIRPHASIKGGCFTSLKTQL